MTRTLQCATANGLPKLLYQESPNYSSRTDRMNLIVLHDTEGGYEGAIATFMNTHAEVSAHFVLKEDGSEAVQMVPLGKKAWHCKLFNSRSIGIEMAGFLAKGLGAAEYAAAARMTAYLAHRYGVPLTWSKDGRVPGICRHRDLGRAGGGHTDPCDDETWQKFMTLVEAEAAKGGWPDKPWGKD